MIIHKINEFIRLHVYSNGVVRLFYKHKGKWFCIKFSIIDVKHLKFTFNSIIE